MSQEVCGVPAASVHSGIKAKGNKPNTSEAFLTFIFQLKLLNSLSLVMKKVLLQSKQLAVSDSLTCKLCNGETVSK